MLFVAGGAATISAGVAGSAQSHFPYPVLRMHFDTDTVTLVIPTPACPTSDPGCVWMLYVNQPKTGTVVGVATGTSGVLTVAFPNYCGLLQADALIGPAPWTFRHGIHRHIDNCTDPTTTTTTDSSTTTTTTGGNAGSTTTTTPTTTTSSSTTTSTNPPSAGGGGTSTTTSSTSALPFTSTTAAPAGVAAAKGGGSSGSGGGSGSATSLPFTGSNVTQLVLLGSLLVIVGLILLSTVESRRRMMRRSAAIDMGHLKHDARRVSDWFLGQ
jgi:uncharacterized membrane protein YgcG